ncbi:MAG: hypothetical protein Q9207_008140, partial [Kuettlingeria erythrocarpa]
NYLGALQQWVRIQNEAKATSTLMFSIVDLHAMTLPQDQSQLRQSKRQALAAILAVGLKPERSTIFFQSAVRLDSAGAHGAHVDPKLYSVNGVSFTYDTVEGMLHYMTKVHLPEKLADLMEE